VALIVETWFRPHILDEAVAIDNYSISRRDREKRKGGGIAAYVRKGITCKIIKPGNRSADWHENNNFELLWLEIVFQYQLLFVLCCYHPPKPRYCVVDLQKAITCDFECLLSSHRDAIFIVAGDSNSLDTSFLEREFGLQQMVISVTHGSKIIDKIFVSHSDLFVCSTFKSIVKTKHCAVLLQPCASDPVIHCSSNRKRVTVYDRRTQHIDCLRRAISHFDWQSVLSCSDDISVVYRKCLDCIKMHVNNCIPSKTVKNGPRDPSYITLVVKLLLEKRRRLRRKGHLEEAGRIADRINDQ